MSLVDSWFLVLYALFFTSCEAIEFAERTLSRPARKFIDGIPRLGAGMWKVD